jgi:RNA recognition motif-containing protein
MEEEDLDTTNVFVKFLPADVDDEALYNMFCPFGRIISHKVMVEPGTVKSLGYGYVGIYMPSTNI